MPLPNRQPHSPPAADAVLAALANQPGLSTPPGWAVLDQVDRFVARFVAFPTPAARTATVLWTAHAHVVEAFDSTPRLALLSPEPGSGKTRTLEVLELLTPDPMHALSASPAPIFRTIEQQRPTLLFDEVDALFGRRGSDDGSEDLRALLNAGHRRGASIPRCVGPKHEVVRFGVYAAVALAGLGDLPDTLMSRSVIIRMRRRSPSEEVEPFRYRTVAPQGHALRDRLSNWAAAVIEDVSDAWPEMPEGVTDRPADCWEALLAVADAAGGHWPVTAREACKELVKVGSREASLGVRLLGDLRTVFGDHDRMATETILERLHALEEAPWSDLRGRPFAARGLARMLGGYGISSTKVRIGNGTFRGYQREHLWDAWGRYLSPTPREAEHPEQAEQPCSELVESVPDVPDGHSQVEHETPPVTSTVPDVPDVPSPRKETEPVPVEGSPGLFDLPLGEMGECRSCAYPTATTDVTGPIHARCREAS